MSTARCATLHNQANLVLGLRDHVRWQAPTKERKHFTDQEHAMSAERHHASLVLHVWGACYLLIF